MALPDMIPVEGFLAPPTQAGTTISSDGTSPGTREDATAGPVPSRAEKRLYRTPTRAPVPAGPPRARVLVLLAVVALVAACADGRATTRPPAEDAGADRGTVAPVARPQDPRPPLPYRSEDVRYPSGGTVLAGTATRPEGPGPFAAVVMLTGSGAQDRDEALAGHRPFLVLADALTRAGYAVLRTDDRGVGGSDGDHARAAYADLAADALAGVLYLAGRPEVDAARIGSFGHSEGGSVAPPAARQARGSVAFAVLMAGPAVSGEDVLVRQDELLLTRAGSPPEQVEAHVAFVRELDALLRAEDYERARDLVRARVGEQAAALPAEQRPTPEQVVALTSPVDAAIATTVAPEAIDLVTAWLRERV